ncbi:uncharacterized protein ACMZJ9_009947 [Mantella aurantiaca]
MASAELCCSLCPKIYTDPVTLKCGHNFCRTCMENKLKEQDKGRFYTCPACGKRFSSRPSLQNNPELCQKARLVVFSREMKVLCTYCQLAADKMCLVCDLPLCNEHLAAHNKQVTHRLIDLTSLENRRCPIHTKPLDYYCTEDDVCVCHDCVELGDHRGHSVESLQAACQKEKEKMQKVLEDLDSRRAEAKEKIRGLNVHESKEKEKAAIQEEQVRDQCDHLIKKIQEVEKQAMALTSRQKDQIAQSVQKQVKQLEDHDQQMAEAMDFINELCNTDDQLRFLQKCKSVEEKIGSLQEMEDTELLTFRKIDVKWLFQHTSQTGVNGKHSVQGDVSKDNLDNGHTDQTDVMDAKQKHQDYTVVKMDPVINDRTYRLDIKSAGLFQCRKTQIKFLVNSPLTIEYTMNWNWQTLVTAEYKSKYDIKGPLFGMKSSAEPHEIPALYLPHLLCPTDFEKNKSYLKCAYFEDGMFQPDSPSKVESSHVVLENPTCSSVGVLIENSEMRKKKEDLSRGTVLIYCKPVTKHFLIHVYLVPMCETEVKKVIEEKEMKCGFRWIDKPSYIRSVSTDITYNIHASEGVTIQNQVLYYLHLPVVSKHYPYAEFHVPEDCTIVTLQISKDNGTQSIWSCVLSDDDLHGMPGTSSTCTTSSDSGKAKTFLQKYYEQLCDRLVILEPILVSLFAKGIIQNHEEELIRNQNHPLNQRIELLKMVTSKGVEEEFYEILKEKDPCLVQDLEKHKKCKKRKKT